MRDEDPLDKLFADHDYWMEASFWDYTSQKLEVLYKQNTEILLLLKTQRDYNDKDKSN